MKKFIVETYYTCTFKTVHKINDLMKKSCLRSMVETDGDVEVIDVKLNNRKTKKIGEKYQKKIKSIKGEKSDKQNISNKIIIKKLNKLEKVFLI